MRTKDNQRRWQTVLCRLIVFIYAGLLSAAQTARRRGERLTERLGLPPDLRGRLRRVEINGLDLITRAADASTGASVRFRVTGSAHGITVTLLDRSGDGVADVMLDLTGDGLTLHAWDAEAHAADGDTAVRVPLVEGLSAAVATTLDERYAEADARDGVAAAAY